MKPSVCVCDHYSGEHIEEIIIGILSVLISDFPGEIPNKMIKREECTSIGNPESNVNPSVHESVALAGLPQCRSTLPEHE